jgi:signal transduction histidine kinase
MSLSLRDQLLKAGLVNEKQAKQAGKQKQKQQRLEKKNQVEVDDSQKQAALQAMADKMRETFNQEVAIELDERIISQMEMGKQGVIFYIVEEAVNNARKHAGAPVILVRLRPVEQNIALLEIVDNGAGFDVEAVNSSYDKRGSLGMINLRERAELVNGLLNIKSAPGQGTTVQVYIPFSEEAADRLRGGLVK